MEGNFVFASAEPQYPIAGNSEGRELPVCHTDNPREQLTHVHTDYQSCSVSVSPRPVRFSGFRSVPVRKRVGIFRSGEREGLWVTCEVMQCNVNEYL